MRVTGPSNCKDGEGWSDGAQGGGSGHLQECKRLGSLGGGFKMDWVPRIHGKALGATDGRYGGRTAGREG